MVSRVTVEHDEEPPDVDRCGSGRSRYAMSVYQDQMVSSTVSRPGVLLPAAMIVASSFAFLYPGDAPWINDEPSLVLDALEASAGHRLAEHGLIGSKGLPYGPLPVWVYQAMLGISHDPVVLVVLHVAILLIPIAIALVWLSRTLDLYPWFAIPILLSPYLWFYSRLLWDNNLSLSLSALTVAAHAHFLRRGSGGALAVALGSAAAAVIVHPMSAALVVPLGTHLVVRRGRELVRTHLWALSIPAVVCLSAWRYWRLLLQHVADGQFTGDALTGFFFPFLGPRLLSGVGLGYFLGDGWFPPPVMVAVVITGAAYALSWAGLALSTVRARAALVQSRPPVRDELALLLVGVFLAQVILDGVTRSYEHPHYYNATWIVYALFAWFAVDALAVRGRKRAANGLTAILGLSLTAITVVTMGGIHAHGGTRSLRYGPTLANQEDVARTLQSYPPDVTIASNVPPYVLFPQAVEALQCLLGPTAEHRLQRWLTVRYASADPRDGRVIVVPP
jgi:hypothetical protein